ncbi:MAG: hypothetical protein AAFQ63_02925 [Cyanobacteria bacterium J06621_11]
MTSNSRSTTQPITFGSASRNVNSASDAYSDSLMDDLFGDVDKILEGDLSACMTFIKPQQAVHTGTRTVQLPANFTPKSTADIYRVTMAAGAKQQTQHQPHQSSAQSAVQQVAQPSVMSPSVYHQPEHNQSRHQSHPKPSGYRSGGRPMTAVKSTAYRSAAQSGNFQSTVIQAPGIHTTIDVQPTDQSTQSATQNSIYGHAPYRHNSLPEFDLKNTSPRPPQTVFEPSSFGGDTKQPVSLPFLLVGAAGISVASTLGLWAIGNTAPGGGLLAFNTEAAAAEIPNSEADFLVYLQKSLENISANHPTAGLTAPQTLAVIPAAAPLPTVPTTVPNTNAAAATGPLPNLPGATANAPSVIERVFVPVYESQQARAITAAPANVPLPNVATPTTTAQRPTVPVPAPVAAAAAIPPGAPAEAVASLPIVPTGNAALPTPTDIAVAPTNSAVTGLTNTTPYAEQVLVGVLNLGSRSAALFDVDGTSQRAYVGDRIGTSEWSLVSVNGQDVVIRRDGEVRSVYIGQRF